ncbi:MAG: BTAD domain-containing putative transcriptional regulator, partial [Gemmatimonadota bacterium]|nr:BTAD domain-containing putative transcriptional regulator [Gemmatimonadota bacterium]
MPAIWISVVGRCEIHLGRSRIKPESAVFFGLLLYLGLRPGVRVTREELLELLWPGSPEQARRHSLRQLLYRIRRAEVPLELDGPEVVLDGANVHSDLAALFDDAWADTVAVEDVPSPLSLFAGYRHSLGPAFAAWVDGVREDACVAIRKACMRHISEGRREGRWPDVETVARIAIVCDPMNETAHMALAEATHMAGAKAEALRVLDTYLWELGDTGGHVGRDARVLRNRISEQP